LEVMAVLFVVVVFLIVVLAFFRHMRGQTCGRGQANGGTSWRRRQGSRAGSVEESGIVCRGGCLPPETTKDTGCRHRGGRPGSPRPHQADSGQYLCLSLGGGAQDGRAEHRQRVQTAVEMQEQLRPEQGCVNECLSRPGKL
jgi:hypothetical protein